ncbi:MAG: LacI family DNA-binding transcriptional regulator [Ktedonobacterales bacterium]|nr:LacI family DNA-binding transcriptional regulator [Ktedonobacterales bacterium]
MADAPVTLRDIAQRSGVSIGTVSRVLNQRADVNAALRQRVLAAASALNYVGPAGQSTPHASGRALKRVAFLLALTSAVESPPTVDPFWADILHGVETVARLIDCQVHFRTVVPDEDDAVLIRSLGEAHLGGVLLVGAAAPSLVAALARQPMPCVLVDHRLPGQAYDAVLSDDFGGMALAIQHLLARGHRQIAFLGGAASSDVSANEYFYTVEQRLAAYRHTVLSAGVVLDPALHVPCVPNVAGGEAACRALLAQGHSFSALACANDKTAIGALKALHAAGLRVPLDVSLVGFDDGELAAHTIPALTTVRVDAVGVGATALRVLAARANEATPIPVTTTLSVTLTERASVRDLTLRGA